MANESKARTADARKRYPLIDAGPEELERRMAANPSILYRILYDIYDKSEAERERRLGVKGSGGRRKKVVMTREELLERSLGLEPSMEPFDVALSKLMGSTTQRQFARLSGISQAHLSRLLNGQVDPDLYICECAARAGNVPPWYFREYRTLFVTDFIKDCLMQHPNVSMAAMKLVGVIA